LLPDRLSKVAGRRVRTGTGSSNWDIHALFSEPGTTIAPPLGMTGSAHEASADGATITWSVEGESEATLFWRSGAAFSLWQGNTMLAQADAEPVARGRARTLALRGNTPLHIKASQGTQLYGVALERKTPGVVVDTIGVPAASARLYRDGVDESLFAEQLSARAPALVVAMIGGNEARGIAYGKLSAEQFEQSLTGFLQRVRAVAPKADCLVVTPMDAVKANATGDVLTSRPELATIVEIQRRVAHQQGCALFDLFAAMGGAGSLVRFRDAGLISDDLVHPTGAGGDVLGLLYSYVHSKPNPTAVVHRRSEQRQGPPVPASTLLALSFPTAEADGVVQLNGQPTPVATRPRALTRFYQRLRDLEDGDDAVRRVAIGQFGASHTAGQNLTDRMRERLVARFGSAGRGLVAAGPNNNRLLPSGVVRSIEGSLMAARC
jgi:lysophospholipase L1-like esterase